MNEEKKEGFEYGYSAPTAGERREIEGIRSKYMPADERQQKLERLKALDRKVKRPAVLLAAVLGVCGVLLFGLGMCMVLEWALYLWAASSRSPVSRLPRPPRRCTASCTGGARKSMRRRSCASRQNFSTNKAAGVVVGRAAPCGSRCRRMSGRRAAVVRKSGKISRAFPQKCGRRGIFLPLPPQNTL